MQEHDDYADPQPPPSRWAWFAFRLVLAVGIMVTWALLWRFTLH